MSHNLSVGFSDKAMIFLAQIVFELQVVFDDAVMHDYHAAGFRTVIYAQRELVSGHGRSRLHSASRFHPRPESLTVMDCLAPVKQTAR